MSHAFECDLARSSATLQRSDRLDSLGEKHPLVSEALFLLRVGTRMGKRTAALAIEVRTTVCMPFSGEEEAADPLASQLAPQLG